MACFLLINCMSEEVLFLLKLGKTSETATEFIVSRKSVDWKPRSCTRWISIINQVIHHSLPQQSTDTFYRISHILLSCLKRFLCTCTPRILKKFNVFREIPKCADEVLALILFFRVDFFDHLLSVSVDFTTRLIG